MEYAIFINQIIILGVLVLIGVLAVRFRVITEPIKEGLAKIIFNITLPLLVLVGISEMDISLELVENSLMAILFSFLVLGMMTIVGIGSAKIAKLPQESSSVHIAHTMFGNIVYLGFSFDKCIISRWGRPFLCHAVSSGLKPDHVDSRNKYTSK